MKTVLLLCLLALYTALHAEPRHALLMGVWDYTDGAFPALPERGIKADLDAMKTALQALGFDVSVVANPSLKDAKLAVDEFGKGIKSAPGTSLFYFSGHGSEFEGKNFLVPIGTAITINRDLDTEALAADRVLSRMEESGGKVNILFLDCCRSGLSKSGRSALAAMEAKGTFIGFATSSAKTSSATDAGSLYTKMLVKHLATPGVSITDMHTLVTREVSAADPGQVPHQYSGLDTLFYFGASPGRVPVDAQPSATSTVRVAGAEQDMEPSKPSEFSFEAKQIRGKVRGGLQHLSDGQFSITLEIRGGQRAQSDPPFKIAICETKESQAKSSGYFMNERDRPPRQCSATLTSSAGDQYKCTTFSGIRMGNQMFNVPLAELHDDKPLVVTLRFSPVAKSARKAAIDTTYTLDAEFLVLQGEPAVFSPWGIVPVTVSDLR